MFAAKAHAGQTRKGNDIPYIYHPMEVLIIFTDMGAVEYEQIAAVLHDTVEDTDVTIDEIREKFGDKVADLVGGHTEDKSKTWVERKTDDLNALRNGSASLKGLVYADKYSNILSLYDDYRVLGDAVFDKFNAGKDLQQWYYGEFLSVFEDCRIFIPEYRISDFKRIYSEIFG